MGLNKIENKTISIYENEEFISFSQNCEKPKGERANIEYKIIYERNTKNGKKGDIREQGYKIENVCYKVLKI